MHPLPLSGRSALVTGASRGIGRAVASALVAAGAHVGLVARSRADLEALSAELGSLTSVHPADVTDADATAAMMAGVASRMHGGPDILVNNAGVFTIAPLDVTAPALFEQTVQANLLAPFRLLQACLPVMKTRGAGHVVTIGSVADRHIYGGNGAYSASKYGARALHEVLRTEMAGTGIRATLIAPAATDTSIWDPIDPDTTPGFPPRSAMLRAADVADAVLWAVTRPASVNIDELRLSRS